MINDYAKIFMANASLLKTCLLQVYIIPTKPNLLAEFLAQYDVWYNRYLYTPFIKHPLLPKPYHSKDDIEQGINYDTESVFLY